MHERERTRLRLQESRGNPQCGLRAMSEDMERDTIPKEDVAAALKASEDAIKAEAALLSDASADYMAGEVAKQRRELGLEVKE